jgi:hypothetical protein
VEVCSSCTCKLQADQRACHIYIAAFRINGVVSPQHAPTIKKPRIQRKMDGCGSLAAGVSGPIVAMVKTIEWLIQSACSAV